MSWSYKPAHFSKSLIDAKCSYAKIVGIMYNISLMIFSKPQLKCLTNRRSIFVYIIFHIFLLFLIAIGPLSRNHYFHNIKKVLNKILTEIGFVLILLEWMLFGDELLDFFDDLHSKFNPFKANQVAKKKYAKWLPSHLGLHINKKNVSERHPLVIDFLMYSILDQQTKSVAE